MKGASWIITAFCGLLFVTGLLLGRSEPRKEAASVPIETENVFYLLATNTYPQDIGSATILDYSKNGEVQIQAVFKTKEERDAFVIHLEMLGRVLNKAVLK
jgi:predicted lactoylglutathione lyase